MDRITKVENRASGMYAQHSLPATLPSLDRETVCRSGIQGGRDGGLTCEAVHSVCFGMQ